MTPNDVKQKRKTIDAAATSAGRNAGSVTEQNVRSGSGAEHAGCVGGAPVERLPRRAHDPDDHREVEEAVREQDGAEGALDAERPERGGDHDRREDERHDHERVHEAPPGEPDTTDDGGEREPDGEREQRSRASPATP